VRFPSKDDFEFCWDWGGPGLTDGLELGSFRCLDYLLFGFAVYLHPQRGLTRMRQKVSQLMLREPLFELLR